MSAAEATFTARKTRVDRNRLEPVTPGYTIFHLSTAYQLGRNTRVSAGVSNVFDKRYGLPLGGVYLSGLSASKEGSLQPLPAYGRSFDAGVSIGF